MFNRQQYLFIGVATFVLFVMYFGCDRIPKNHKSSKENTVASSSEDGGEVQQLIKAGKTKLNTEQAELITSLEQQVKMTASDTAKSGLLKKLSGAWYRANQKTVAGFFANQVALIDKTENAWNIAGSTLFEGIGENEETSLRKFCTENAVKAFENAIALNPSNVEYQIASALCFTENPPEDNPMKGILMLRELDTKFPENAQVLFQLAKLAMRTNQYDKAVLRLEQILKKNPNNPDAICLIGEAFSRKGEDAKAAMYAKKCENLLKR
jgi:tetratricopeptide (TPR) repeat protein